MIKVNQGLSKIFISFLFIFVLVFGLVKSEEASSATFNVPGDFATIQEAIDSSGTMNGDTINIAAGTHVESFVRITKELIIQGQGIGNTILDPSSIDGVQVVLFPDVDNVIIRDLTIQNAFQAIRFDIAGGTIDNTDIIRVEMLDNESRGIEIHNETTVTNLFVDLCNFENTNHGLRISSSGRLIGADIQDSTFTSNDIGFYLANEGGTSTMSNVLIRRNVFTDHTRSHGSQGAAIYFEEGQGVRIRNNDFVDNRRDVQILKWYQPSIPVSNVIVSNNRMTGTFDAVFSIFNNDRGGPTTFSNVRFVRNEADTNDGSAVFAGAYSSAGGPGTGWNAVRVRNNCFTGITTPGNGVRYFVSGGNPLDPLDATLDVVNNWWGTANAADITALMQVPDLSVNDYMPFRTTNICATVSNAPVVPGTAGVTNHFSITGATPNGDVAIIWGDTELPNNVAHNICTKLVTGIQDPEILGMDTADGSGNATVSAHVDEEFAGVTRKFQSVDMATCTSGDVMEETF